MLTIRRRPRHTHRFLFALALVALVALFVTGGCGASQPVLRKPDPSLKGTTTTTTAPVATASTAGATATVGPTNP